MAPPDKQAIAFPQTLERRDAKTTTQVIVEKRLTLKKSFSWTLIGNLVYAFAQWCNLSIIAKFFSAAEVGAFGLALAIATPIFMFSNLQLRSVIATDAKHEYSFSQYLALRLLLSSAAFLLVVLLATLLDYPTTTKILIVTVGLMKAFDSISDIYYGLFQSRDRLDMMSKSLMIKGTIGAVTMATLFYFCGDRYAWCDVTSAGFVLATVWGLVFAFYDLPVARRLGTHTGNVNLDRVDNDKEEDTSQQKSAGPRPLLNLMSKAAPLGLVMLLTSLTFNVQRYFIEYFIDMAALGVFVALSYVIVAGNTLVLALGRSVSTTLARHYAQRNLDAFYRLHRKFLFVSILVGIGGIGCASLFGQQILTLLYSREYANYVGIFVVLMIGGGLRYMSMSYGVMATAIHAFKEQAYPNLIVFVATVVFSICLVPPFGLYGAAVVTCLVASLSLGLNMLVVRRKIREDLAS